MAAALLAFSTSTAAQGPILPDPKPFPKVDVVGGPWVNLATFPVRPMVITPSGTLWAVNHHDSTIERFIVGNPNPDRVYPVPWSPVAIAYWPGNGGAFGPELLVVCRGTWAVVGVNPSTGAPTRVLQLRPGATLPLGVDARIGRMAEPGDILVDDVNHRAFVSCTGADSVIQIDLVANQIVRVFNEEADNGSQAGTSKFRIKSPLFLSWSKNREFVLCAPLHSGNNTMAEPNLATSLKVVSYAGGTPGLPDEDLFRINPYVNAGNPGSVQVMLNGTGTILFAHGINPNTDDFWQLNTEALNTKAQTEPELKGDFLRNRVSIVQNNGTTWGSVVDVKGFDPLQPPPSPYSESNTVGQPFALDFRDADGYGFITGLLTDNVLVLDQNGNYDMEWDLPAGSIPHGILVTETTPTQVYVYCWGDNKVRSYTVDTTANTATLTLTYGLKYDPTPPLVAEGRKMFFDADRSQHKNVSCASCHVEAGNDFLVWNLSNGPLEEKGPMFTQTLVGLQRLAPFHWRGERSLADFNEFGFKGLLGASSVPSAADFAGFEAYIFSLSNPANPNQDRKRLVNASIHHPDTLFQDGVPGQNLSVLHQRHSSLVTGNAVAGIDEFQSPSLVNVGRHSCVDCHDFPTGTNNDINVEQEGSPAARRAAQKPAPFHEGWRKRQSLVRVNHPSLPSRDVPFLGSGFSHIGEAQDLFSFVSLVIDETTSVVPDTVPPSEDMNYGLDDQKANDITDLVHQWDQGLGLAAHFAYLLDANNANSATTTAELTTYLANQRLDGNCDIAVIGMSKNSSGVPVRRRWAWMNLASAFVCEDPAFANRSLAAFQTGATNGETNVFLGLPPGMAERWAIDYDMDGVRNLDATENPALLYQYNPTQPGWNNGVAPRIANGTVPVIVWESTRVARLVFTTNEPTSATIVYDEGKTASHTTYSPIGGDGTGAQRRMARFHSVLLTDLRPSTSSIDAASFAPGEQGYAQENVVYTVTITIQDATGNVAVATPFTFDTDDFIVPAELEGAPGTEEPPELKNQRTHTIEKICLGGSGCDEVTPAGSSAWNVDVELDLAFKRGQWQAPAPGFQDGEPQPAAGRAVVGRVMILRGGAVLSAPGAGVTVGTTANNTVLVDTVIVNDDYVLQTVAEDPVTPAADRFLAGTAVSGSDGKVHVLFSVANVLPGDRIIFNVEAVVEVRVPPLGSPIIPIDTSTAGQIEYYSWRGINQWSFPNTKEKNSSVTSMAL